MRLDFRRLGAIRSFGFPLRRAVLAVAVIGLGVAVTTAPLDAQSESSPLSDLGALQRSLQNGDTNAGGRQQLPPNVILQPSAGPVANAQPSRLEQIMSRRAGVSLRQFGYDQFGNGHAVSVPQLGAVEDSYILGPGDDLVVSLRGQENSEYRVTVDRDGNVTLPRINPIPAAGRTLGDFRADLQNAVQRAYISTQVFVSIGQLRQFGVTVSGEVNDPGTRLVTGLSTPLDAILVSGGVKKTGSLRRIELIHNGRETTVDLYGYLSQSGQAPQVLLSAGDRIIVPSLGETVAAVGWLRNPAIYELPPGASAISVRGLINLAGGLEVRGRYRLSVMRVLPDGSITMSPVNGEQGIVRDSDILFALPSAQQVEQQGILSGGTTIAGPFSVENQTKLSDLLKSPGALGNDPYTLFGLVVRRDTQSGMPQLISFSPVAVLQGRADLQLQSRDIVRIFTANEARLLDAVVERFERAQDQSEQALRTSSQIVDNSGNVLYAADADRDAITMLANMTLGVGGLLSYNEPTNEIQSTGQTVLRNGARRMTAAPADQNAATTTPPTSSEGSAYPGVTPYPGATSPNMSGYPGQAPPYSGQPSGAGSGQPPGAVYGQPSGSVYGQAPGSVYGQPPGSVYGQPPGAVYGVSPTAEAETQGEPNGPTGQNMLEQVVPSGGFPTNAEIQTFGQLTRQLNIDALVLVRFLMDNEVSIFGSVRGAGIYLVGPGVTLADMVQSVGGVASWTDKSRVELISTEVNPDTGSANTERKLVSLTDPATLNYELHTHDEIRFEPIYTDIGVGTVTLQGQVRYGGTYNIERGEHLSDLLLRAGGLTDVAYPYGTVFLRKSAAEAEAEGHLRESKELQDMLTGELGSTSQQKTSPETASLLETLIEQVKNEPSLGRISIIADPTMLAADPGKDPLLEPGDVIYIPQRPSTVSVVGQVMQEGSYPFDPKATAADYIKRAGGYGPLADSSMAFIVLPDGTARSIDSSWFGLDSPNVPPGSAIVVPRDLFPLDERQLILDVATIVQNLALSAASLAVINHQ